MATEIQVKRYAAYYRGWCQAFGEHEAHIIESADINWLYGEEAIGLMMSRSLQRRLTRHLLGRGAGDPVIQLMSERIQIRDETLDMSSEADRTGLSRIRSLFNSGLLVHMYLTSHVYYPAGTRIITFSTRKPIPIMYKEITPLCVRLSE